MATIAPGDRALVHGPFDWYGTVSSVTDGWVGVVPDEDDTCCVPVPADLVERATGVRVANIHTPRVGLLVAGRTLYIDVTRADGAMTPDWSLIPAPIAAAIRAALPGEADGGDALLTELLTDAARDAAREAA